MPQGRIALFDMDGTLFDHNGALKRDMLKIASPEDIEAYNLGAVEDFWQFDDKPFMKARIDLIRRQPDWWRFMPKFQLGWDVYEVVKEIGFCCKIYTKGPASKPMAWMEKVQCIHDHFGPDMPVDIAGKNKDGNYGRILVDDYPDYLTGWLKHRPRGLAIMPAWSYNSDFTHPNVIRYTGENLEEVRVALQAAWDRDSKEHWKEHI